MEKHQIWVEMVVLDMLALLYYSLKVEYGPDLWVRNDVVVKLLY